MSANSKLTWKKLGLIISKEKFQFYPDWINNYFAVPIVRYIKDDLIKIYFTTRNKNNQSMLGSVDCVMSKLEIQNLTSTPLFSVGEIGTFDDSGVMATDIIDINDDTFLYYIGWNLGTTVPFRNSIGIAKLNKFTESFERLYKGPILDRTKDEPHFCASCCVLKENNVFRIWYLSCVGWSVRNGKPDHNYHIKYAESSDGINWQRNGVIAIDFESEYEYAISVPRVLKFNGMYHMWFSSRATKDTDTYRIRYANSLDGIVWNRTSEFVLDVSDDGWDSEMVCYPYVFRHKDKLYILYNGNGYGKTGIGLAVCEDFNA